MAIKDLITELNDLITDARGKDFTYSDTDEVPNVDTSGLTYEGGNEKKGKKIKTCVLYVDIRESVKLIESHQFDTMGQIYTAFTKSVLKIADYHNGKVRNIIGDRVMIVFPSENCFTNAVNCAISINHSANIINTTFKYVDFKCGIGIDYGEMRILKVGIEKKGEENQDNKNLVWVGYPANIASRLTDVANKEFDETYFEVRQERKVLQRNPAKLINKEVTVEMFSEEFSQLFSSANDTTVWLEDKKNFKGFDKKTRKIIFSPILITEDVFNGYKKANSKNIDIVNNWWKLQSKEIKNVKGKVYESGLTWKID